jgi:hypothetical protein
MTFDMMNRASLSLMYSRLEPAVLMKCFRSPATKYVLAKDEYPYLIVNINNKVK